MSAIPPHPQNGTCFTFLAFHFCFQRTHRPDGAGLVPGWCASPRRTRSLLLVSTGPDGKVACPAEGKERSPDHFLLLSSCVGPLCTTGKRREQRGRFTSAAFA